MKLTTIVYDLARAFNNGVRTSCIDDIEALGFSAVEFSVDETNNTIEFIVEGNSNELPSHISIV